MSTQKKDKSSAFKRLAEARTNKALDQIRVIGNLANRNNYSYTYDQAKKIIVALKQAVNEIEAKFKSEANNQKFEL